MAQPKSNAHGFYLYAFTNPPEKEELGAVGLYDSNVFAVTQGQVSAIVSEIPISGKLRPERRHLSAHQEVLKKLVQNSSVILPVSFGTIADSPEAIKVLLKKYDKTISEQVERVKQKFELEVRVALDVPNIFDFYVKENEDLKVLRDQMYDGKKEPGREEKIELGQLFEKIVQANRDNTAKLVEKILDPHCYEFKRNRCRNESEMLRLSCLIGKDKREEFEAAVSEASGQFDDNYIFEFNGPFPPYNFVEVHMKI